MKKLIALTALAGILAGCDHIDTVNGVPLHAAGRMSTQNELSFCEANPVVCVLGGAVALGAVGYLASQANGEACTGIVGPDGGCVN